MLPAYAVYFGLCLHLVLHSETCGAFHLAYRLPSNGKGPVLYSAADAKSTGKRDQFWPVPGVEPDAPSITGKSNME